MNPELEAEITVRDEITAGPDKENKIQDKLIREQNVMIKMPEHQISDLRKLLDEILKAIADVTAFKSGEKYIKIQEAHSRVIKGTAEKSRLPLQNPSCCHRHRRLLMIRTLKK